MSLLSACLDAATVTSGAQTLKSKLVIGVEGRSLSGPLSGIGRFLTQTLINMPSDEVDIRISCRKPISTHFSNVTELPFVEITQVPSLFGLPVYKSRQEDVFWGPAHRPIDCRQTCPPLSPCMIWFGKSSPIHESANQIKMSSQSD